MLRGAIALQFGQAALVPELHGESDHRAALLQENCGHGGRVDAAGHGDSDEAGPRFRALWKRVELRGSVHGADFIVANSAAGARAKRKKTKRKDAECTQTSQRGKEKRAISHGRRPFGTWGRAGGVGQPRRGRPAKRNRSRPAWSGDRG